MAAVATGAAFGTIAFFRLERYRQAIAEQNQRIALLEGIVRGEVPLVLTQTAPPLQIEAPVEGPAALPAPATPAAIVSDAAPPAAEIPVQPAAPPPQAEPRPAATPEAPPEPPSAPRPEPAALAATPAPKETAPPEPATEAVARPETYRRPPEAADSLFPTAPPPAAAAATAPLKLALDRNLLTWAGGGLLAAGIIAILVIANERGVFGQMSQFLLGYFIGGCLLAGAEVMRRRNRETPPTDWQARHAPAILGAAGLICAFGIGFVGHDRLHLLSPAQSIGFMGATALGGLLLSLWHGRTPAWTGLLCGLAAPALLPEVTASPPALFAYLFALGAGGLALAKHRGWVALGWAAAALSIGWVSAWTLAFFLPPGVPAAGGYLVALALLGVSFAWEQSAAPADLNAVTRLRSPWGLEMSVGMATIVGVGVLLLALSLKAIGAGDAALWALIALLPMLAAAGALREGFAPAPVVIGAFAIAALAATPALQAAEDASAFAAAAGALGLGASIGGWLMMWRNRTPTLGAILSALAPVATLLIAYLHLGGVLKSPLGWGVIALALAAVNGLALDRVSSASGGADKAPGAATAFTVAAAASAVMAGAFALDQVRMAAGVAILLAPLAWLDRRLNLPALRIAGAVAGAVTLALLSPISLMRAPVEPQPFLNSIGATFIVAILSVWAGARLFALGPAGYEGRVTVFLRAVLVALVLAFGWAEIRHLANKGVLTAPYTSLAEAGGNTLFLLAVACGLAARFGAKERPLLHWTEILAFGVALAHAVLIGLLQLAPWWGTEPAAVAGPPVFNTIALAYLAPALLLALYAMLRRRLGSTLRAYFAAAGAFIALQSWLILETRRLFHPTGMATAPIGAGEHAAYSVGVLAAGALALAVAFRLKGTPGLVLRGGAAALTAIAFAKGLAIDAGLIAGPGRFAAYALLAAAAAGAGLGFHRYVFPRAAAPAGAGVDGANLVPPRP